VGQGATNRDILLGVALEAAFFGCLLFLMSHGDVSFVWPLTSLGFVLTTFAAKFWLGETVVPLRWCGVLMIVLGAGIITYTEKSKKSVEAPTLGKPAIETTSAP
jgi:drug/metabolite transporter (DMT)-like permease